MTNKRQHYQDKLFLAMTDNLVGDYCGIVFLPLIAVNSFNEEQLIYGSKEYG